MKVSELIASIVETAELKFGHSEHMNDTINVGIYYSTDFTWQAYLERPTQVQLDMGEINPLTAKRWEANTAFFTENHRTLVDALLALQDQVGQASEWDFQP